MDIMNQVEPLVISVVVSIAAVFIKYFGDKLIELIETKKDIALQIVEENISKKNFQVALEVWHIVDEKFRLSETIENATEEKIHMFNDLLLKKIPGLTQDEISYLRQALAGEINQGKAVITADERVKQLQDQLQQKLQEVNQLSIENAQLKQTVTAIQNTVNK